MSTLPVFPAIVLNTAIGAREGFRIRIRKPGSRDFNDLSQADSIYYNALSPDGTTFTVQSPKYHPEADWSEAIAIVPVTPDDVTSLIGTWKSTLFVNIKGSVVPVMEIIFEVRDSV